MQQGDFSLLAVKSVGHRENNPGTAYWQWALETKSDVMTREDPLIITNNFTQEFFKDS